MAVNGENMARKLPKAIHALELIIVAQYLQDAQWENRLINYSKFWDNHSLIIIFNHYSFSGFVFIGAKMLRGHVNSYNNLWRNS